MRTLMSLLLILCVNYAAAADKAVIRMPSQNGTFAVEISQGDDGKYNIKVLEGENGAGYDLITDEDSLPPERSDETSLESALITPDLGPDRALILIAPWCPGCVDMYPKLYAAFARLATVTEPRRWKIGSAQTNDFQIVDVDENKQLADAIEQIHGEISLPLFIKIEGGKIVREFKIGCTTPLDDYALGWLYTGVNNRPDASPAEVAQVPTSGHYPLRGSWWSVGSNWRPSHAQLVSHLSGASAHRGKFELAWLQSLSAAELNSVHSDDHEGRLKGQYVNKMEASVSRSTNTAPQVAPQPVKRAPARRAVPRTYCPTCPRG